MNSVTGSMHLNLHVYDSGSKPNVEVVIFDRDTSKILATRRIRDDHELRVAQAAQVLWFKREMAERGER